jgi:hypothetical protein
MPFKSLAQEHFMYSQHPKIAAKWSAEFGPQPNLPKQVSTDIKQDIPQKHGPSPWMHMKPNKPMEGM